MASELSPEKEVVLEKLVAEGRFPNRRQALDHAVDLLCEETETLEAIREGLTSIARGEGIPFRDGVAALRAKYQIPEAP